jgi:hypothetical protein
MLMSLTVICMWSMIGSIDFFEIVAQSPSNENKVSYRRSAPLGDSFITELLVHGKAPEVSATALDALLAVELEAVAVEERSCGKTGKSGNPRGASRVQRGLDATVKAASDTATANAG